METIKSGEITSVEDLDIRPVFTFYQRDEALQEHLVKTKRMLLNLLPAPLPFTDRQGLEKWLAESVPLLEWTPCKDPPSVLTISFLSKPLNGLPTETFIQEMIKRWLIPHKETTILSFQHMQFFFEHYLKEPFFIAEAKILIRNSKERDLVKMNLPLLKKEVLGAVQSGSYAKSILETKNLPIDRKSLLVRESLLRLMQRFPDDFDEQILHRFAFAQSYTSEEFQEQRAFPHLTRMIASMYLIRNRIERELRILPEKRHIILRFMQTKLSFPFGKKPVLGMTIGLNLFHKFEFFEEKHILLSVQKFFPHMRLVSGSFHRFQPAQNPIVTLYIELEKEDGSRFFPREVRTLRDHLVDEFSKRIEHLVPSLFMVRNEEEIMRNILLLSKELKALNDLPQMMISFDQHSQDDLIFTIALVRVRDIKSPSLQELLENVDSKIRFIPDRVQNVRYLDKDHPIEANVFRLQIEKLPIFLRMDFSVNLYLARQEIVSFLTRQVGEVRDYNGGMILKQGELLAQFKRLFQDLSGSNHDLLENFFHSLNPIESQATIPLNSLSFFFDLFLGLSSKEFPKNKGYDLDIEQNEGGEFAVLRGEDATYKPLVEEHLKAAGIYDRSLVSTTLTFEGSHYLGYYLSTHDEDKKRQFKEAILSGIKAWADQRRKKKVLRLATSFKVSLDPRIGGMIESSVFIKFLFEGLMRRDEEGHSEPAVAESYQVSENQLRYTFKLRETYWSDGSPLVAYDFEYAWKKILSPHFSTPFSSLFYPIKNAQKAKNGSIEMDAVGVKAVDDRTLIVDLEYQAPYFIELTAHTLYSPVHHKIDQMHPNWSSMSGEHFICNGPFRLKKQHPIYTHEMERNPYYWKSKSIYFDRVVVNSTKKKTCLDMFERSEVDYIGPPFQSFEDCYGKLEADHAFSYPCDKLLWISLNTERFPFTNVNMRRALAASIQRKDLVNDYASAGENAFTILPRSITQHYHSDILIQEDQEKARNYFQKALEELQVTLQDIPEIVLSFPKEGSERVQLAESIAHQWEVTLGIQCEIEYYDWVDLFDRMTSGQYQAGFIKWYSWFKDPIYTLNAFKNRGEGVNFSSWENADFQALLKLSFEERSPQKRLEYLSQAEEILTSESPVIPLFYDNHCFYKNPQLIIPSKSFFMGGNFDFSQVRLEESE